MTGIGFPAGIGILSPYYHVHTSLLSNGYWGFFPQGQSGRGVKLITRLYLVPRFRMNGAITSTPPICLNGMVFN
jgi:hypothetical protein